MTMRGIHHVEVWVADFEAAIQSWGWLLEQLGYSVSQEWTDGRSFRLDDTYIVLERSADLSADEHDRLRPGLNHLAFHAGNRANVDRLASEAVDHGWSLLFADRHPYAGGDHHYAAYLENNEGFEVELCAMPMADDETTMPNLDEIERRCLSATAGPWKSFVEGRDHVGGDDFIRTGGVDDASPDMYVSLSSGGETVPAGPNDLDFIANARQDVLDLIAALRRIQVQQRSADAGGSAVRLPSSSTAHRPRSS